MATVGVNPMGLAHHAMTSNPNHEPTGGLPPVPVTAWTARFAGCTPAEAVIRAVSRAASTYTRVGQLVIDLHPTPARVAALIQDRRRLIAVVADLPDARRQLADTGLPREHRNPTLRVWVSEAPAVRMATSECRAGLILATSHDPARHPAGPAAWAASARRALRPGGHLAIVCTATAPARPADLISVASRVGLTYTQRVLQFASMPPHPTPPANHNRHVQPNTAAAELYLFTAETGAAR